MAWRKGPLPPDTWGWGGIVPLPTHNPVVPSHDPEYAQLPDDDEFRLLNRSGAFQFACFCGTHVAVVGVPLDRPQIYHPDEIEFYNNSLTLPPPFSPVVVDPMTMTFEELRDCIRKMNRLAKGPNDAD